MGVVGRKPQRGRPSTAVCLKGSLGEHPGNEYKRRYRGLDYGGSTEIP
ncbi:MAG: hypothetical protein RMI45_00945 [Ignisphaera sp.]|nr:hypothetical protein [Ignisphaera sp.]MDW8084793.1 hypothetical protein [Ignisphaera sp.]